VHSGTLGEEFTNLYRQHATRNVVMVERSVAYLNWRYLANPIYRHEVITARQAGRLVGYAVFRHEGTTMTLVDLLAGIRGEMVAELIRGAVALAWQRGFDGVGMSLLASSAWVQCLRQAGFKQREATPVVVYGGKVAPAKIGDERDWFLLDGDRDS
jgi:hypothetical protein